MLSDKLFRIVVGLLGITGQAALGVYFSGILVPRQLDIGAATSAQLIAIASQDRVLIVLDAWLLSIGTLFSVIYFVALVHLSRAGGRFSGWMAIVASIALLGVALGDATFTLAAVNAAVLGHATTTQVAFDFIAGPGEAFDYTFLFVPAPFLILSLGAVLLQSRIVPRVFGYAAFAIGFAFVGVGIGSIFSPLAGNAGTVFEVVQLGQVVWVMASAIVVLVGSRKA